MVIRELKLKNFGKFVEKEIELKDGINVIYGDNEAGKSTIHTFIRGMLFGITKTRGRITKDDVYTRYLPWSNGGLYQGSIDIEVDKKRYRIHRNFHKDYKNYRIVDLETGRELNIDTEEHPLIPGLTEANYRNTISIEQLKASTEKEIVGIVQNYITNLTTAKSSEVNVVSAIQYLQTKRKTIEANNTNEKMKELTLKLKSYEMEEEKILRINDQLQVIEERQKVFRKLLDDKIKLEDELSLTQIKLSEWNKNEYHRLEADLLEYEELLQQEKNLQEQNYLKEDQLNIKEQVSSKDNLTSKEYIESQNNEKNKSYSNIDEQNSAINPIKRYKDLLLSLAGTILIVATNPIHEHWLLFMLLFWAMNVGYIIIKNFRRNRMDKYMHKNSSSYDTNTVPDMGEPNSNEKDIINYQLKQIAERKQKILFLYKAADIDTLKKQFIANMDGKVYQDKLREYKQNLEFKIKEINQKADEMAELIFDESHVKESRRLEYSGGQKTLLQKFNYANECELLRYERLKWELEQLGEKQTHAYEDKQRLMDLKEKLKQEDKEIQAINLSIKTIEQVSMQIHDTFGNKISNIVSNITARITKNRYNDIKIDEKFNVKVLYEGDYIPVEKLSVGTIHQIYLALRIAISKLLFEDKNMPLILDDCFAYYDDKRLKESLKELQDNTMNQVIIFTCHHREIRMLDELGMDYYLISLSNQ